MAKRCLTNSAAGDRQRIELMTGIGMQGASTILRSLLRFACVFALVMVGFAHKPVPAYPATAQISAYQLPDGTFASICFDDHDSRPHAAKDFGCDACRLTNAVLLPAVPAVGGLAIAFAEEVTVIERRQRLARALYPPSTGPRAPPTSSMFA
jgi:hypothetical protein